MANCEVVSDENGAAKTKKNTPDVPNTPQRATAKVISSSSARVTDPAATTALAPQTQVPTARRVASLDGTPKRRPTQAIPTIPTRITTASRRRILGPTPATNAKSSRAPITTIPRRRIVLAENLVPLEAHAGRPNPERTAMPSVKATVSGPITLSTGRVARR